MLKLTASFGLALALGSGSPCAAQIDLPEGTKIGLRLEQPLSSATEEEGQSVRLSVIDEVKIGDNVLIAKGATATGTVITSEKKRRLGRSGKLDFSIDKVTAIDGQPVPVRYNTVRNQGGSHSLRNGVIAAGVGAAVPLLAPLVLLGKGKDSQVEAGSTFEVFTDAACTVKVAAENLPPPGGALSTGVMFTSDPSGAEIEIDGEFMGSAPSELQLKEGDHLVVMKKDGARWERKLTVKAGSSLTVNARLR